MPRKYLKMKSRPPRLGLAALIILTAAIELRAVEFNPVLKPEMGVRKTGNHIKIDGRLENGEWDGAGGTDNFVETDPGKNLEPKVKTEAFIAYDDDNLYVAFRCYDDPSLIRATMCQRDLFGNDDAVFLNLDTYGNATWAYELFVNPYGVQKDFLWSNVHGDDRGFDLIWQSAASVDDSGYEVEMAIPFASLRFPDKDIQNWKIDLGRYHPRESFRVYTWTAYDFDDQCWVCQWGSLNGIQNVKPGKGIEILPSLIANQSGALPDNNLASRWHDQKGNGEISLGSKYSISSAIAFEGAYNPDFSQIEADAAQIDVNSTISLIYPERRPFFQEGRDIFQTLFNSFYTRTVNDPQFAAKMTGRLSRTNIGFLSAYDENTPYIIPLEERSILVNTGKSFVNVLRGTGTFGNDNHLGFIVTDRRFEGGGYGSILSADSYLRLSQKYSWVLQVIGSFTEEQNDSSLSEGLDGITFADGKHTAAFDGETYAGDALITQLRRRSRNWSFTIDYNHVSPSYRTETGYDPWNNYRNLSLWNGYTIYPENGIFEQISPEIYVENRWNYDGDSKWTHLNLNIYNRLRWAQAYFGIAFHPGAEMWNGVEFKDLWNLEFYAGSRFSDRIGCEANFNFGPGVAVWIPEKGNELSYYLAINFKPIDRLTVEPTVNYSRSRKLDSEEMLYKQLIARSRFELQANKQLSIRLVVQYNDNGDNWDIDPLLTYRLSPFSMIYFGSTHDITQLNGDQPAQKTWKQTSQQFFMKLQYLFRI